MISFIKGEKSPVSGFDDLYSKKFLLGDDTQNVLLPYVRETQNIMTKAIKQYDPHGYATIIPSMDFGFSYNVGRIFGGFSTGMVVDWDSRVPFFPIDTTMKTCAGSVFELKEMQKPPLFFNASRIEQCIEKTKKDGFCFDFKSGNHFFSLFRDSEKRYYLVVHCGDDSFRDLRCGVYPYPNVWYEKEIHTMHNESNNRFLKYLIGDSAQRALDFCSKRQDNIKLLQKRLAEHLIGNDAEIKNYISQIHYGLLGIHTLLLGVGAISPSDSFPIFSKIGKPILIINPTRDMWSVSVDGTEVYLYPHGWGGEIRNIESLCHSDDNTLVLKLKCDTEKHFSPSYKTKLPKGLVTIRDLNNYADICNDGKSLDIMWNHNLFGSIKQILYPCASYDFERKEILTF